MGVRCQSSEYWDALIKQCKHCRSVCKQPHAVSKCTSYCVSANCKAQAGHYYDGLLKKCVWCAEVCGRHPAECSQHCQTEPPPVTTKKLLTDVTSQVPNSRGLSVPTALADSTLLLYPLLALCMVLLLSSLSLALVVFLRGSRAKTSNREPKEADHNQECVVQPGQEVGWPRESSEDFVTNSSRPTDHEPTDDTSPTETCVCVHCFPDLKALGQGNDRSLRASFSFYPQAVLHRAQIQKGGPLWTEENLQTSEQEVQAEAAVG